MPPADRRDRPDLLTRGLQVSSASLSLVLVGALAVGASAGASSSGDTGAPVITSGHHGGPAPAAAPEDSGAPADETVELAPGTRIGADGRVVHDHGDLEVTVMLATDDETEVAGPVAPGAWVSFVNHTTSDQVLASEDGTLSVEVPLVQLVMLQAPVEPGTYRLASRTDRGVAAEIVVRSEEGTTASGVPGLGSAVPTASGAAATPVVG